MSEQITEHKTEFMIKIDQPTLNQVLKAVYTLVQEITFTLDADGMSCRIMDPSHVALINITMPNGLFEQYEVIRSGWISFRVDEALKIIADIPKTSTVKIFNDAENLIIMANNTTYYLKQIEASANDTPLPKIPYDAMFESYEFTDYIKRIEKFSPYFSLETSNNVCNISGKSDQGELIIKLEKGMDQLVNISSKNNDYNRSTYGIEYLLPYLKTIPKGTLQKIEYSGNKPIRHQVKLSNYGGFIDLYIAPRVEN